MCGAAIALALLVPALAHAQKLVLVVRHAERADGGGGTSMTGTPADPALSAAGGARAMKLAGMLADAGIRAIFSTPFKRTQDTVKPLAAKIGVAVTTIAAGDTAALVARLRAQHGNDVVLIVGHSNTVPGILKALGGPDVTVADTEYDSLFVLVPASGTLSRIRY